MVFARNPGLLARFREGDPDVLEAIYRAHVDQVTRISRAMMRALAAGAPRVSQEMATELADLVQDVFANAFAAEARKRFDGQRPYGPYLAQIARNVAVDHWRLIRRRVPADLDELLERLSLEKDAGEASADRWADLRTVTVLERYLAALPPEVRRVYEAIYISGLSQRESAVALGLGRQAIRGLDGRLRAGLRLALNDVER